MVFQPFRFAWSWGGGQRCLGLEREHARVFEAIDRCTEVIVSEAPPDEQASALGEVVRSARRAFREEEEALARAGCPELEVQAVGHGRMIDDLVELEGQPRRALLAGLGLVRFCLVQHILGADRRALAWVEDRGQGEHA